MTGPEPPQLQLRGVHVALGGRPILHGIDLSVAAGEVVALVGANGCGKSTALRVLVGELAPARGAALLQGRPLAAWSRRDVARRVAVMHQQLPRVPGLTVAHLVAQGRFPQRGLLGMLRAPMDEAVPQALEATGTAALADRLVDSLSGGERQRVRLALALAQQAPILVLDEPTTFLDVCHQLEMLDLVTDLARRRGLTVVTVLHDLEQAARYAGRVVALAGGRVVADGPGAQVLDARLLARVFRVEGQVTRDPQTGRPRVRIDAPLPPEGAA